MVEALFYAFFVGTGLGFLYDLMRFFAFPSAVHSFLICFFGL